LASGVSLHYSQQRQGHRATGLPSVGFHFQGYASPALPLPLLNPRRSPTATLCFGPTDDQGQSVQHFKDQIRRLTRRKAPVSTRELIDQINPVIRGWGLYFCKAHVRGLFHRLDGWIVRRIWSHRFKRWRNAGWKSLPERRLYGEYGLVNLVALIPSLNPR
jgi:RNA-directed DNA polymerase